jgi:hypothetical protein
MGQESHSIILRWKRIPPRATAQRIATHTAAVVAALLIALPATHAQQPTAPQAATSATFPEGTPRSWAEAAVANEIAIVESEGRIPVRYRQHKVDAKGDTLREIVETRDGTVARLIQRNGQPLTAADDAGERDRLNAEIADPDAFYRHHKRDKATREDAKDLIKLLPQAMIYTYASGQPQRASSNGPEVVLDFRPDPAFKPPMMTADLLTGIEGRVWIDARSHCMVRVEAHVLRAVNFGFGVVAKIFPGGSVEFEQTRATGDRWAYSHLEEHITARVLLVKTVPENTEMTSFDFRPMPSLMPYQDAVRMLLAMPVELAR